MVLGVKHSWESICDMMSITLHLFALCHTVVCDTVVWGRTQASITLWLMNETHSFMLTQWSSRETSSSSVLWNVCVFVCKHLYVSPILRLLQSISQKLWTVSSHWITFFFLFMFILIPIFHWDVSKNQENHGWWRQNNENSKDKLQNTIYTFQRSNQNNMLSRYKL